MNTSTTILEPNRWFLEVSSAWSCTLLSAYRNMLCLARGRRASNRLVVLCALVLACAANESSAQEDPPGCSFVSPEAYFVASPTSAFHGQEVCVRVFFTNSPSGGCNVTADADLKLGDGSSIRVLSDAL